jgi:hypothetical protein
MKKVILSLLLATAVLTSAFANTDPDPKVLDGFKKEFPAAQQVSWSKLADFDKASFIMAGCRVIAYFTKEGSLEGSVRDIFFDQVPLAVMTAVDKRYENAAVSEVREINNPEGTFYKIKLESRGKKYQFRVSSDGNISEVERIKK